MTDMQEIQKIVIQKYDAPQLLSLVPIKGIGLVGDEGFLPVRDPKYFPKAEEAAVTDARIIPIIYHTFTGASTAGSLYGLTRGAALVGYLVEDEGVRAIQAGVQGAIEGMATRDDGLPTIYDYLLPYAAAGARQIVEHVDAMNLRNMLAFNLGLWWVAGLVIPPNQNQRQRKALKWLEDVMEHYAILGFMPE